MREQREQILFVAALVLAGLLTYFTFDDRYQPLPIPSAKRTEVQALSAPAVVRLDRLDGLPAPTRSRPVFAPPRELLPLEPLVLPDPPPPAISVRRPAVAAAESARLARAHRMTAEDLEPLIGAGLDVVESAASDDEPAALPGPSTELDAEETELELEGRYDWVDRVFGGRRLYGRLLNDEVHTLDQRATEDLHFREFSTRTHRPIGDITIPRADVLAFALARTFENGALLRSRALGRGPGWVDERVELALDLLADWPAEPRALEFAEAEAVMAAQDAPQDPTVARVLAHVRGRAFDREGQLTVYRRAVDEGWADAALLSDYAELAAILGLTERAWELLDLAARRSRASAEARLVEAQLRMRSGDADGALAALERAEQIPFQEPFEAEGRHALQLATARALIALGRPGEAVSIVERVLAGRPDDGVARALLGAAHAADDALGSAAEAYRTALALEPTDGNVLTDAAIVAWRQGDVVGAQRMAEQCLTVDPYDGVRASLALGFFHEAAGSHQRARDAYAGALAIEPDDTDALYRMGRSERRSDDPERAASTLRRALRLGGPDVLLLMELARAAVDLGRADEAARYCREALRLEPGNGEVLWLLGHAQLLEGDLVTAIDTLEQAVAAGEAGAQAAIGVALHRRGEPRAALDRFDEVLRAFAGRADRPAPSYAQLQGDRIRDNLSKLQWVDAFGRSSLQRGWTENQWEGSPRVFIDGQELRVEGRMDRPRSDERPGIRRAVEGPGFVSVEAELSADAGESRYGVSLTYRRLRGSLGDQPKARLDIWVDAGGEVRVSAINDFVTAVLDGAAIDGVRVEPGRKVELGIEVLDAVAGQFVFTVDGSRVGEPVQLRTLRGFQGRYDLDVYGDAPPGRSCTVAVSRVRIVQEASG